MHYLELIKLRLEDKVFLSVIVNFVFLGAEEIKQFSDQVKIRLISQLIKGISRVFHKFHKYFNGTAILTSFVLPTA